MAKTSKIQWTDATWNPWHGCKKVSPGCKYCYMFRDKERYGHDPSTVLRSKTKFNDPLRWQEELHGLDRTRFNWDEPPPNPDEAPFHGMKIFTCSWSDFFIEDADEWRPEAWKIIKDTPEFTYQILTKRPERIAECLPDDWGQGYENVWLGVSVESQEQLDRMCILADIPAKVRFLSLEPLIGPIDLYKYMTSYPTWDDPGDYGEPVFWSIHWVIIGGESGNETGKYKYRPCRFSWIDDVIDQCHEKHSNIPVFVKQLGTYLSKELGLKDRHGGDMSEWPEHLQVREFPNTIMTIKITSR